MRRKPQQRNTMSANREEEKMKGVNSLEKTRIINAWKSRRRNSKENLYPENNSRGRTNEEEINREMDDKLVDDKGSDSAKNHRT
jgi:hypothetical protein